MWFSIPGNNGGLSSVERDIRRWLPIHVAPPRAARARLGDGLEPGSLRGSTGAG
jgi:hypothetical protein